MRSTALGILFLTLAAPMAAAFDIEAMSEGERAAFRSEIRAYLLENPEVLMEAISVLEARRERETVARDSEQIERLRDEIFNDGISYVGGDPDGDVTLVEFLDYRCGFCKRAFPAVEELVASDGNIRYIIKEFPILGEQSTLAAQYAIATKLVAGDADYKSVHNTLMLHDGAVTEGFLVRTSRELELDHDAITDAMDSEEVALAIGKNHALAQALNVQGTPGFILGDIILRGFLELEQMREIVADIRANRG
ncbi:MAG: DsbA family protein [Boseongicola sp.]|nr:DsbA family protein [Boseongicola sp.]MDE0347516.1 DsbA family protein [Boseongicola sp.]